MFLFFFLVRFSQCQSSLMPENALSPPRAGPANKKLTNLSIWRNTPIFRALLKKSLKHGDTHTTKWHGIDWVTVSIIHVTPRFRSPDFFRVIRCPVASAIELIFPGLTNHRGWNKRGTHRDLFSWGRGVCGLTSSWRIGTMLKQQRMKGLEKHTQNKTH